MQNKINFLALATLILFSGILGSAMLTKGHNWGGDFSSYIMQTKSIIEKDIDTFVEKNSFTTENSSHPIGPAVYPWGTSLLLVPLYKLFGLNMSALKSINIVFYLLFLASIAFFLRERHSKLYLLLFISLFALNPVMLSSLNNVLSDIPFLFFSTTSILLVGRILIERRPLISNKADNLLLGTMFAFTFFIRPNGILLVFAAMGAHFFRSIQTELADKSTDHSISTLVRCFVSALKPSDLKTITIHILPYITFIGLTLILRFIFPQKDSSYLSYFQYLSVPLIIDHIRYYFELPVKFFKLPHAYLFYVATLPLLSAGIIKSAGRDYHILLYVSFTIFIYVIWPPTQTLRFIFPLLPFYLHFVFIGLQWCLKAIEGSPARVIQVLAVCLLLLISFYFVRSSSQMAFSNITNNREVAGGPFTEISQDMFSFIRENVPEDAVVVFWKPRVMRMFTDRLSILADNIDDMNKGSHLCIHEKYNDYDQIPHSAVEKLEKDGVLKLIFANPDFRLYQIITSRN